MRLSAGCSVALMSDDLPAPDTPVTATITPSGIFAVTFFRLCSRAPVSFTQLVGSRRVSGTSMRSAPDRKRPVIDVGDLLDLVGRALGDHLAAVATRAGTEVDDPVGRLDRRLVVLDDEHGVAEVAQAVQRPDQPLVVALVQADRRLVEHVQHARQLAAELRREPDALRLAARQRARARDAASGSRGRRRAGTSAGS